jgi:hypothetical protein
MMASLRRTLARLLGFVGLGPSEKVLVEELRFHLAELTKEHEKAGHSPEEANRKARHQLTLETTKEEWRDESRARTPSAARSRSGTRSQRSWE